MASTDSKKAAKVPTDVSKSDNKLNLPKIGDLILLCLFIETTSMLMLMLFDYCRENWRRLLFENVPRKLLRAQIAEH